MWRRFCRHRQSKISYQPGKEQSIAIWTPVHLQSNNRRKKLEFCSSIWEVQRPWMTFNLSCTTCSMMTASSGFLLKVFASDCSTAQKTYVITREKQNLKLSPSKSCCCFAGAYAPGNNCKYGFIAGFWATSPPKYIARPARIQKQLPGTAGPELHSLVLQ